MTFDKIFLFFKLFFVRCGALLSVSCLNRNDKAMNKEEYIKALSFFTVSFQFFSLVQNVLKETINQGNEWIVISEKEISFDGYANKTSWSDHQVIIPILFNFYHGLELFLKGLLQFDPEFELKAQHSIEGLSARFIKDNKKEKELCDFLKKYTHLGQLPTILREFLSNNNLTINCTEIVFT